MYAKKQRYWWWWWWWWSDILFSIALSALYHCLRFQGHDIV